MDDFDFYVKLAKPLVLNLPDAKDRTLAAQWLKKLHQIDQSVNKPANNIHVEYLKLLLFVMQGNRLTGIFERPPPEGDLQEILQSSTDEIKKAKDLIDLTKRRRSSDRKGSISTCKENPPVRNSISGDFCEFVAVQEIPGFGIHGYYAFSTEPMTNWSMKLESDVLKQKMGSRRPTKDFQGSVCGPEPRQKTPKDAGKKLQTYDWMACEDLKHSERSLRKILEKRRNSMSGVETRPCWGRNRYIDRLIDESPHLVGDLDVSEADALLYAYRDKKLKKVKKSKEGSAKMDACSISSRRRQVEARLDMPPCAPLLIPEEDFKQRDVSWDEDDDRSCFPTEMNL